MPVVTPMFIFSPGERVKIKGMNSPDILYGTIGTVKLVSLDTTGLHDYCVKTITNKYLWFVESDLEAISI
jgi:hypothetical protein